VAADHFGIRYLPWQPLASPNVLFSKGTVLDVGVRMGTVMLTGRSRGEPAPVRDTAGVERLYRAQRLSMVRLALLLVDDRETAEDVAQDAFAALHRQWTTLASDEAALAYLRRCVVNGARSVLRRRRTVRQHPAPDEASLTADGADRRVLLAEEHREVIAALWRLPTRQREVIVLRYWSEMTEPQVATALGISVGAVKSMASRGRDAIAASLGGVS
jgi:RNA polymerase sigma-70 factor (sigma-E family)